MILKTFYDEEDYMIILKLLNDIPVSNKDKERVRTRQAFLDLMPKDVKL
jgi:hypothetical protein